jgi:GPH family glycoside/pentoside/hexuronide:cation symporter
MTTSPLVDVPRPKRLSFLTKCLYAAGSSGNGLKRAGLSAFLLLYYNQVVGLPAASVGAVLAIAMVFDALIDPVVGYWSDHTRSRLGRRHPFMYASIIPLAVCFALLWMAPVGWSEPQLLTYLLVLVVLVRMFDTFFEVPSAALLAEMTTDYDERTALMSMRHIFAILSIMSMRLIAFGVFFKPAGGDKSGVLSREGFANYGLTCGVVIFIAISACCIGTHGQIAHLYRPAVERHTAMGVLRQIYAVLNNRSMLAVVGATVFMSVVQGAINGLQIYMNLFIWGLTSTQLAAIVPVETIGLLAGAFLAMHVARRIGKRRAALLGLGISYTFLATPLLLRLGGLAPADGSTSVQIMVGGLNMAMNFGYMLFAVLAQSMMVDLVEQSQVRTGRRSEGVILSADSILQKAISGSGVLVSGLVLTLAAFPPGAKPGAVAAEVLNSMSGTIVFALAPVYLLAAICLWAYTVDRRQHEANIVALAGSKCTLD